MDDLTPPHWGELPNASSGNWQETLNDIARLEAENARLREGLKTATAVFDWLAENEPDCYGWVPPVPSVTPGIKVEADRARAALEPSHD